MVLFLEEKEALSLQALNRFQYEVAIGRSCNKFTVRRVWLPYVTEDSDGPALVLYDAIKPNAKGKVVWRSSCL